MKSKCIICGSETSQPLYINHLRGIAPNDDVVLIRLEKPIGPFDTEDCMHKHPAWSSNMIADSSWNIESEISALTEFIEELRLPRISVSEDVEDLSLPDLSNAVPVELERLLGLYASYLGYVETRIAHIKSEKAVVESIFQMALGKAVADLEAMSEKRRLKDGLEAEAIVTRPRLRATKQRLIRLDANLIALEHFRDALQYCYNGVSRVVSLRLGEMSRVDFR